MGNTIPPHIKICDICKHYWGTKLFAVGEGIEEDIVNVCLAFPDIEGIPEDILLGKNKHTKKHPDQDNDIVFEKRKE